MTIKQIENKIDILNHSLGLELEPYTYNKKTIEEMETFDIDNPMWSAVTSYTEAKSNLLRWWMSRDYKSTND